MKIANNKNTPKLKIISANVFIIIDLDIEMQILELKFIN